jgi:hypothetical protein
METELMATYYKEFGYKTVNGFRRNIFCTLSAFNREGKKVQKINNNIDIYYSIFQCEDKDFSKTILAPLYFDIDGEYGLLELEKTKLSVISLYTFLTNELKLKKEEIQIYFSGAKGFHVLVAPEILGLKPEIALNRKIKNWVQQIIKNVENSSAFDLKIYDARRLFRLPNSINSKTGLYKIPVTIDEVRTLNLPGLQQLARTPRECIKNSQTLTLNSMAAEALQNLPVENTPIRVSGRVQIRDTQLPPCIEYIMSQSINRGNRNNIVVMLASALFQHNQSYEDTLQTLFIWNASNTPPLPVPEVGAACRSAYRMTKAGKGYGCSSIRSTGLISSNLCRENCEIFRLQSQKNVNRNQRGGKYLG